MKQKSNQKFKAFILSCVQRSQKSEEHLERFFPTIIKHDKSETMFRCRHNIMLLCCAHIAGVFTIKTNNSSSKEFKIHFRNSRSALLRAF